MEGAFPGETVKRWLIRIVIGSGVLFAAAFGTAWWTATPDIGAKATGERLATMQSSPQWISSAFANKLPQVDGAITDVLAKELAGAADLQEPDAPLPVVKRTGAELAEHPASGLRVTWLGHSTMLVDLDGARVLVDPVWGERASPWSSAGPARFYEMPLPLSELPAVDAVLISHDHYDHLDYETVSQMRAVDTQWLVPLGIGAHLEHWGIPADRITELDWWEDAEVAGLTLTATPARHFSGRWLDRMSSTLWVGWSLKGPEHSVFYSGDTALHPELADIGQRLGPFDLTLIEAGAYDSTWTDVHLGPEQAVIAHQVVGGGVMMPVHWGMFDLGNHSWTEPMERILVAAQRQGVPVLTPRPGGSVELADAQVVDRWWPRIETTTIEVDPVWSTSVEGMIEMWWGPQG